MVNQIPEIKSEEIPESQDGAVHVLVAKQWDEVMIEFGFAVITAFGRCGDRYF